MALVLLGEKSRFAEFHRALNSLATASASAALRCTFGDGGVGVGVFAGQFRTGMEIWTQHDDRGVFTLTLDMKVSGHTLYLEEDLRAVGVK